MQSIKTVKRFLKIYCRFYAAWCLKSCGKEPTLEEVENPKKVVIPMRTYYRLFTNTVGIIPDRILTKKRYKKIRAQLDSYDKFVETGRRGYIEVLGIMEKYYARSI